MTKKSHDIRHPSNLKSVGHLKISLPDTLIPCYDINPFPMFTKWSITLFGNGLEHPCTPYNSILLTKHKTFGIMGMPLQTL